jgi:hypothetical protein
MSQPAPNGDEEKVVYPVFQRELMLALVDGIHRQNSILTSLKDVLLDLRDELAYMRVERKKEQP